MAKKGKTSRVAQRERFKRAARHCKGRKLKAFRVCMSKELKKKKR